MSCHCTVIILEAVTSKIQHRVKLSYLLSPPDVLSALPTYTTIITEAKLLFCMARVKSFSSLLLPGRKILKPLRTVIALCKQNSLYRPSREFCKVLAFQTYLGI